VTMRRDPARERPFRIRRHLPIGAGLVARVAIPKGEQIHSWAGCRILPRPSYQSVQIGAGSHAHDPACLNLLNHGCEPNLHIDIAPRTVSALRDIHPGELLTIFYPATEWDMARPFRCRCSSRRCLGWVRGARYLSARQLAGRVLSRHIRRLLRKRASRSAGVRTGSSRRGRVRVARARVA
jgi:hypothetical protein